MIHRCPVRLPGRSRKLFAFRALGLVLIVYFYTISKSDLPKDSVLMYGSSFSGHEYGAFAGAIRSRKRGRLHARRLSFRSAPS